MILFSHRVCSFSPFEGFRSKVGGFRSRSGVDIFCLGREKNRSLDVDELYRETGYCVCELSVFFIDRGGDSNRDPLIRHPISVEIYSTPIAYPFKNPIWTCTCNKQDWSLLTFRISRFLIFYDFRCEGWSNRPKGWKENCPVPTGNAALGWVPSSGRVRSAHVRNFHT